MPTADRERLAVLGSPIAHSRSPLLHRAAYEVLGLDYDYTAREVTDTGLADFLASLDDGWRGFSLTMPLKRTVLELADDVDAVAARTGTANTLLLAGSGDTLVRRAFNTDVPGLVRTANAAGITHLDFVHILGAGATAACALQAAVDLGASRVTVSARNTDRAAWLLPIAEAAGVPLTIRPLAIADRSIAVPDFVVSTLPGGAEHDLLFTASTRRRALLLDVSYDPWPSRLALTWQETGGRVLSGLALLVHQALLQVRVFVSGHPDTPLEREDEVLDAMLEAVGLDRTGAQLDDRDDRD